MFDSPPWIQASSWIRVSACHRVDNRMKIGEIKLSDTESTIDSTPATALDIRTNQDNDDAKC